MYFNNLLISRAENITFVNMCMKEEELGCIWYKTFFQKVDFGISSLVGAT